MTKADLILEIASRTGHRKSIVHGVLDEFFQVTKEAILSNHPVQVRGFGTFYRKRKASKKARNLHAGTTIDIPEHDVPAYKPSKEFQNCLREK